MVAEGGRLDWPGEGPAEGLPAATASMTSAMELLRSPTGPGPGPGRACGGEVALGVSARDWERAAMQSSSPEVMLSEEDELRWRPRGRGRGVEALEECAWTMEGELAEEPGPASISSSRFMLEGKMELGWSWCCWRCWWLGDLMGA